MVPRSSPPFLGYATSWKKGIDLDSDACMYSARHTYAKRMIGGHWGRPVTLEVLSGLMGISPKVCWDHYSKWCDAHGDPLWDATMPSAPPGRLPPPIRSENTA